jgi:hypothetical protein
MAQQTNKQVEGVVEHTAHNTPTRFGVKVDGNWYDGWGQCPDVKGRNVRIEYRGKGRFRDIQTIAVIEGETTEQVYQRPPKTQDNQAARRYPVVFEEYVMDDVREGTQRRCAALSAAAGYAQYWTPDEVLRRAKQFEDWLAGGPTPASLPAPRVSGEDRNPW